MKHFKSHISMHMKTLKDEEWIGKTTDNPGWINTGQCTFKVASCLPLEVLQKIKAFLSKELFLFKLPAKCELNKYNARKALKSRRLLRLYFTYTHYVLTHFSLLYLPFPEQRAYCSPKGNTGSEDPLGVSAVQHFTHMSGGSAGHC